MKALFTIAALLLASSASAFAGAANADLLCRSKSGVEVKGSIPGDFAEFDLTVSHAGASSRLFSVLNQETSATEENAKLAVVESQKDGVWTLSAELLQGYGLLHMYALPKTFRGKSIPNGYQSRFTAKAWMNLPELGGQGIDVSLDCTLHYEI
jgi:hypothetical protein